jgi:excisionase family DNA binding protein
MQVEHSRELGQPGGGVSPLVVRKQQRPQFLTAGEAAEFMRVSDDLIYDLIRSGEFPAIKLRNRYVVPLLALQRLEADALAAGSMVDVAEWTGAWLEQQRQQVSAAWAG